MNKIDELCTRIEKTAFDPKLVGQFLGVPNWQNSAAWKRRQEMKRLEMLENSRTL